MSNPDPTELQRLRYRQGQMLRGQDFRDEVAIAAQLRWWHNRAIHNTFGVIAGFAAALNGPALTIGPGLAYDSFGRELLHMRARSIAIPAADGLLLLLARYKHTRSFDTKAGSAGICPPGDSASEEQPDFIWKQSNYLDIRDGVPIARIAAVALEQMPEGTQIPANGRISYDSAAQRILYSGVLSTEEKDALLRLSDADAYTQAINGLFELARADFSVPLSRPQARPHIGNGATTPGNTIWEPWNERIGKTTRQLGLQLRIDTSAAGFTEVPCYFAWLQWPSFNLRDSKFLAFLLHFEHIAEESTHDFALRLWTPVWDRYIEQAFLATSQQQRPFVSWIGVQGM